MAFYLPFRAIINSTITFTSKINIHLKLQKLYKLLIHRDAIMTVFINYFSSFAAGAVIFMYLGYMSEVTQKPIADVAKDGKQINYLINKQRN